MPAKVDFKNKTGNQHIIKMPSTNVDRATEKAFHFDKRGYQFELHFEAEKPQLYTERVKLSGGTGN